MTKSVTVLLLNVIIINNSTLDANLEISSSFLSDRAVSYEIELIIVFIYNMSI